MQRIQDHRLISVIGINILVVVMVVGGGRGASVLCSPPTFIVLPIFALCVTAISLLASRHPFETYLDVGQSNFVIL